MVVLLLCACMFLNLDINCLKFCFLSAIRTYLGHYAFAILLRLAIHSPLSLPSPLPLPFSIRGRIGQATRAAPRDKVIKACGLRQSSHHDTTSLKHASICFLDALQSVVDVEGLLTTASLSLSLPPSLFLSLSWNWCTYQTA